MREKENTGGQWRRRTLKNKVVTHMNKNAILKPTALYANPKINFEKIQKPKSK